MNLFQRRARRAKSRPPQPEGLRKEDVIAGFELLLGHPPADDGEIKQALRLADHHALVDHLIAREEFRARYERIQPPSESEKDNPVPYWRPPIFLGDRVLCWTHRSRRIYLVPQDIDLTPRILLSGDWENHVEQTMLRLLRPGDTVIDLGSNVGYHTLNFCDAVTATGKVYAFEPHPELMRLLEATMFINHFEDLAELHCCAVADRPGTVTLALPPGHFGSGNIVPAAAGRDYETVYPIRLTVPAVTLDAALGDRVATVDLIHMDIEGAESLALHGARSLIERSPAVKIVTEWSLAIMAAHDVDAPAYISWLAERGFRFWRIDNDTADLLPLEAAALLNLPHSDLLLSRTDPD